MSSDVIKTCTIMPLPPAQRAAARRVAVEETERNLPSGPSGGSGGLGGFGGFLPPLATEARKQWKPGRVLKVGFLGGHPEVRRRLIPYAKEWEDHANITFDFQDDGADAEIRVAFLSGRGSWSYLGTDALLIARHNPTMNFGWLTPETDEDEYSRVVLHEFGHALACIHEHQHPEQGIPWDQEKVYEHYRRTNGWSREEVNQQLFAKYSRTQTNFSAYDKSSIMHYPVDNALTVGNFSVGWNRKLSDMDKEFIARLYPGREPGVRSLPLDQELEAEIGALGEEDVYSFEQSSGGSTTLETRGGTDVVMSLFGPDDSQNLMAFDDDGGQRLNSRIRMFLPSGKYWVRIRHYSPKRTGKYTIRRER